MRTTRFWNNRHQIRSKSKDNEIIKHIFHNYSTILVIEKNVIPKKS